MQYDQTASKAVFSFTEQEISAGLKGSQEDHFGSIRGFVYDFRNIIVDISAQTHLFESEYCRL